MEREKVDILKFKKVELIKKLFREGVPEGIIVRPNPKNYSHYHSYGGLSPFFKELTKGRLLGTECKNCDNTGLWLPPRLDCPDCWGKMEWRGIDTKGAKVYTYSVTNYPGAGFKATVPCPLISLEIPGVCTKFMSYLSAFGKGEPYIGMPVKPKFRIKKPTYTILDLSWVPTS